MIRTLVLLCAWLVVACVPMPPASSVQLLGVAKAQPCIGFPEEPCRAADRWAPTCEAFVVQRGPQTLLVTASHCVPDGARGMRFYAPSGWGHERARLLERLPPDVALLTPADPTSLAPLRVGRRPGVGDVVHSGGNTGRVVAWLDADAFETEQAVVPSWSGAPVLDASGAVVGVVSRCHAERGVCLPGHTIVAALPRELL